MEDANLDITSSSADRWGSAINLIEGNGNSNTDVWSIVRQTTNGNGDSSLRFNFGSTNSPLNNNIITYKANGNIGIGTNNPVSKLEVNGDIALVRSRKIKFLETIGGSDRAYIKSTNGERVGDFNSMIFAVGAGSESMIIKGDTRYVGIGTTNPSEKLDVAGNIKANEFRGNWDGANVSEVLFKGANSENWNTAVKNGIYRKKAGVNNPFGGGHSTLFNLGIHGGKNYGLQLATDNDKRLKYRGFKNNNTFSDF